MGFFDFFKSGGVLGQMVTVVGKSYLMLDRESGSMLKNYVGVVAFRYVMSSREPNRFEKAKSILKKFKTLAEYNVKIGLGDVCMFIAESEMDVKDIEDHVGEVILKNLRALGISDNVIYGKIYDLNEVTEIISEFSLD